ncbi:hypothetical protein APTSU1_000379600 [Apodemus speciosus]|uniref:Uncharacterized protein n=1 Tax=Apodemus speciosus TaxID=105296 RepID=A0ABQ0ENB1_APOSI
MDSSNEGDIKKRLMRLRSSTWTGSVLKGQETFDSINVEDESQWDEAVCTLSGCQHPQCWASLRRIERGHPRILDTSPKSPRETEGRSRKALRDKDVTSRSPRPPKLSVLNLNEAKLPFSEDVRHMVVTWVPEETEKSVRPAQKTDVSSRPGKKRRKKLGERNAGHPGKTFVSCKLIPSVMGQYSNGAGVIKIWVSNPKPAFLKSKPSLYYRGKQYSRSPAGLVPPPSPVQLLEQLSSEAIPLWAQVDMLPQDLLKECILAHEKSIAGPEMKMELSKIRKSLPLEKSRPESALSSKMCLTIQRLTLQDAKKAKRNVAGQYGEEAMPSHFFQGDVGLRIAEQENEQKLLEEEEMEKTSTERRVSLEEAYEFSSYYTDYYTSPEDGVLYETFYQDFDEEEDAVVGYGASSEGNSPKTLYETVDSMGWNPDLKLLRILQATEEEEEESHHSRAQSEA